MNPTKLPLPLLVALAFILTSSISWAQEYFEADNITIKNNTTFYNAVNYPFEIKIIGETKEDGTTVPKELSKFVFNNASHTFDTQGMQIKSIEISNQAQGFSTIIITPDKWLTTTTITQNLTLPGAYHDVGVSLKILIDPSSNTISFFN